MCRERRRRVWARSARLASLSWRVACVFCFVFLLGVGACRDRYASLFGWMGCDVGASKVIGGCWDVGWFDWSDRKRIVRLSRLWMLLCFVSCGFWWNAVCTRVDMQFEFHDGSCLEFECYAD